MSVDGDVRELSTTDRSLSDADFANRFGFIAGSKAVDALHRMLTSLESFFHPSNAGSWTIFVRLILS